MSDREKSPTHPHLVQALDALKSPAGLELPPGWPEIVEEVRDLVQRALDLLDGFNVPDGDLWCAGWPAAVTWRAMLDPAAEDSVRSLLTSALNELSPERRADLYGGLLDAMANGTHSGTDGAVELLVGADALAQRTGGGIEA